jgi:hypothetical protein
VFEPGAKPGEPRPGVAAHRGHGARPRRADRRCAGGEEGALCGNGAARGDASTTREDPSAFWQRPRRRRCQPSSAPIRSDTDAGTFGYVRIFTFNVRDAQEFVDEFVRLVGNCPSMASSSTCAATAGASSMPPNGCCRCSRHDASSRRRRSSSTRRSICSSAATGAIRRAAFRTSASAPGSTRWRSRSRPDRSSRSAFRSPPKMRPTTSGRSTGGPKVLITDALCYSATDMFAAAFQDHGIGPILGVDHNTGAGGANVWSHRLLLELMRRTRRSSGGAVRAAAARRGSARGHPPRAARGTEGRQRSSRISESCRTACTP